MKLKNIIYSILILIINFNICYSQNIDMEESDISKILCTTWILDYGMMAGQKITGLEEIKDQYIFKPNNTYKLGSDNSFTKGTWKYNVDEKCIDLIGNNNNEAGRIKYLNENYFILIQSPENKSSHLPIENLEFYFKPIEKK